MENSIFSDFKKAVSRLEESVTKEKTIERRDSALMRFQLSFDTAIKSLGVHKTIISKHRNTYAVYTNISVKVRNVCFLYKNLQI